MKHIRPGLSCPALSALSLTTVSIVTGHQLTIYSGANGLLSPRR